MIGIDHKLFTELTDKERDELAARLHNAWHSTHDEALAEPSAAKLVHGVTTEQLYDTAHELLLISADVGGLPRCRFRDDISTSRGQARALAAQIELWWGGRADTDPLATAGSEVIEWCRNAHGTLLELANG